MYNYLSEPTPITEQKWPDGYAPLVTTRTITFMHEAFIRDCIEGILMQKTTFPVEVVIHDDASTDKTAAIVREYEAKYPRLIKAIYQKENQFSKPGKGTMREDINKVIRGRYIALCEGDDYWTDPLKLQKQVEFLERNEDYSMSSHEVEIVFEGVDVVENFYGEPIIDGNFEKIINAGLFIALNSIVYRKELLLDRPEWLSKLPGGHKALIYMLTGKGKNYHFMDKMAVKRRNPGGITYLQAKWRKKNKIKYNIFLLENLKTYLNHEKDQVINKRLKQLYLNQAKKQTKSLRLWEVPYYLYKYLVA